MTRAKRPPEPTARQHPLAADDGRPDGRGWADGAYRVQPAPTLDQLDAPAELDEPCAACIEATGGACRAHQEPECTCYELTGGHQPGCYFNRKPER